jgi:hypothetical protein
MDVFDLLDFGQPGVLDQRPGALWGCTVQVELNGGAGTPQSQPNEAGGHTSPILTEGP